MKNCTVIPFPLARRRSMICRLARYASQLRSEAAERHIQLQLQVQADTMRRRGVDEDLVRRELKYMESAVRTLLCRSALVPDDRLIQGGPNGRATNKVAGRRRLGSRFPCPRSPPAFVIPRRQLPP
jgi:hypothetical protein